VALLGIVGNAVAPGFMGSTMGKAVEGIGESLRTIGSGSAKLLDPLFSLRDLLYGADVSGCASVGPVSQEQGATNTLTGTLNPSSSTITWSSGTTATVPTLSAAATSFYRNLGVSVN